MGISHERRVHPRARVKVRVEAKEAATGRPVRLHTEDLSEGGARCRVQGDVGVGACLEGHLFLPLSEAGRDVDVPVPFRARVARRLDMVGGVGVEVGLSFTEIAEADRDELRRFLLEWMADDCVSHACLASVS
jgi:c-di-GMP-binding flagellar brake protein YcgR